MKLIVGLGNPGPKYQLTRHNIGFLFINALAENFGGRSFKNEFKSETQKLTVFGEPVIVCKPQTFMNLSGEAVQPLLHFYNLGKDDLLVVHDEIDQPYGALKFQSKRGHGGHNGIRNIHERLGGNEYARLRLGVGRPPVFVDDVGGKTRATMEVVDWVLQNFTSAEMKQMPDFLKLAAEGLEVWMKQGLDRAATEFNGR